MSNTPRMDKAFNECKKEPRMNWQASQCYEEGAQLERERNQSIAERDELKHLIIAIAARFGDEIILRRMNEICEKLKETK